MDMAISQYFTLFQNTLQDENKILFLRIRSKSRDDHVYSSTGLLSRRENEERCYS